MGFCSAPVSSWVLTSGFISPLQPTFPFELGIAIKFSWLGPLAIWTNVGLDSPFGYLSSVLSQVGYPDLILAPHGLTTWPGFPPARGIQNISSFCTEDDGQW